MAGTYVGLVLQGMTGVDPSAKLVAVALADVANIKHAGLAFPAIATLVDRTGICERQVQQHLRNLVGAGWLEVVGATHGGRGMATRYRLNLPRMRAAVAEKGCGSPHRLGEERVQPTAPFTEKPYSEKGAVQRIKGCGPPPEKGAAHRTRTGSEPVITGKGAGAGIDVSAFCAAALRTTGEKDEGQPENGANRTASVTPIRPADKPKARTRDEQIAWLNAQLAAQAKGSPA